MSEGYSGSNVTRLQEVRRRRALRRLRRLVLVLAAAGLVALYFTGAYSQLALAARETFDSVRIALSPGAGWPAKTGIPEVRKADTYTYYFRITGVANHEDYSGSFTVTITRAEVDVIWGGSGEDYDNYSFTYNGEERLDDVTASVNLLGDDGQNISLAVSVQGDGEFKNANAEGEYYSAEGSFRTKL